MTRTHGTRTFAALAAASALALTACGGGEDSSDGDSSSSSTTSSSEGGESPEESSSPSEESSEEDQASGDAVTARKSGLSFELPDGWEVIDPSELSKNSANAPQSLKDMAKSSGTTVDQLLDNLAQTVDLMAMGETKQGFAENVNVIPNPQPLTEAQLKSSYEQQGGTVTESDEVETSLGAAPMVTYTMAGDGQTVQGAAIAVPGDEGAAVITVSTTDEKKTEEVLTTIVESVKKA